MIGAISAWWVVIQSNPWQLGVFLYVIIGLCVVGFILLRGPRWRNPPTGGLLWDKKDNVRNILFEFLDTGHLHPIGILIEILLWPLWLTLIILFYEK
jgi:Gpi18-like mannosyltransferase